MAHEIEKNIPIPDRQIGLCKYPFNKMDIGDSFVLPTKLRSSTSHRGRILGFKFLTRKIDDENVRVWRIA